VAVDGLNVVQHVVERVQRTAVVAVCGGQPELIDDGDNRTTAGATPAEPTAWRLPAGNIERNTHAPSPTAYLERAVGGEGSVRPRGGHALNAAVAGLRRVHVEGAGRAGRDGHRLREWDQYVRFVARPLASRADLGPAPPVIQIGTVGVATRSGVHSGVTPVAADARASRSVAAMASKATPLEVVRRPLGVAAIS
jgi:hypothetical protein